MAIWKNDAEFDAAVKLLWDFLVISEKPVKSDAIFVFGGPFPVVAEHGAELYHRGFAPVIVVTGNRGSSSDPNRPEPEGLYFARILRERNVPASAIVVEHAAIHTGDNVRLGMEALNRFGVEPKTLVVVAHPYHTLRCIATFRKQFPRVTLRSCPPGGTASLYLRGRQYRIFAKRLIEELVRIRRYPGEGYTVPVEIPPKVEEKEAELRRLLERSE